MVVPEVTLTHLNRADGSATYTYNGYSVIGAVNGPIEVLRRDEMPEEATIEVNVRPAIGVGSPKERHLEALLHNTLRSIILTRSIPRTLVQITLQIKSLPEEEEATTGISSVRFPSSLCGKGEANGLQSLTILPHLLHTAFLALLSASIPLRATLTSTLIALPAKSTSLLSPTANELLRAKPIKSIHVFAFSGDRRLLLNESDGAFSYEEWEEACERAEEVCCGEADEGGVKLGGEEMEIDGLEKSENLEKWLRQVVKRKVEWEQRWKSDT
ncbi:hypothetical protein FB567DRAFT_561662 [Paraphoma chrysanthemicola]|uniref:Exoribonuclease phosphorolytic domain-containing protein n=1 Tax=Paraphoma chrysanthemicola TaxID=798071 RepID=A0A8K0R0Q5_9PLEO|nr:hypothetical protein FB567DRAFT_561662 [Paraphoma chrysanthemicola]